jgi:hypothetical protein
MSSDTDARGTSGADSMTIEEYRGYVERATSERAFQKIVEGMAKQLGWLVFHLPDAGNAALAKDRRWWELPESGFPDLVAVRDGVLLFAELKTMKGKLSPAQECWQEELVKIEGGNPWQVKYRVWKPNQFDEIVETLARPSPTASG